MTEDQDAKESQSDTGSKTFVNKTKDKKIKPWRPLTKIILRRLPPSMTEEAFLEQVSPIPDHDFFYFAKPDPSLGNNIYCRAYINFVNLDDIYLFRDKFDGYVFLDEKGLEYVGIVEYASFQKIPKKKKKKDPKCGTIESDPVYQEFVESLNKEQETDNQPKLEYSYPITDGNEKKVQSTPLLEYLAARKQDKRGRDERRRRENDKRKMRIERKAKDVTIKEEDGVIEVKMVKSRDWDKESPKEDPADTDNKDDPKSYRDRKPTNNNNDKKKIDKEDEFIEDADKSYKKDKKEKKDSPREQKSKKYSDTRKERLKQEPLKSDKQSVISKIISSEGKKSLNHDDIKPFTQLPQVKTDDLINMMKDMERKAKLEECNDVDKGQIRVSPVSLRRGSVESSEGSVKEERGGQGGERGGSTEREGSEEKSDGAERRVERRIRNKDRPSLAIYQPGMGKFSKQRLAKEKDTVKVNDNEKKDT